MTTRGAKQMLAEANAAVDVIDVETAKAMHGGNGNVFVDVREAIERQQTGSVAGAMHVSRGFLEFQADPDMPGFNPVFGEAARLVLYCASGGRSALAAKTLQDMGYDNVCHVAGGFNGWIEAGGPVEAAD